MRRISSALAAVLFCIAPTPSKAGEPAHGDYYGDPLPPAPVARLGTMRLRHFDATALTFSKDGKRLTSYSEWDRAVRVWDAASGKLVERKRVAEKPAWLDPPEEKIRHLPKLAYLEGYWARALAPDGKRLAAIIKEKPDQFY